MANLKQHILLETNGGLDFFTFVLGELELETENRCKNVLNPFYSDSNPGLSIYKLDDSDRWKFKDHGDDSYNGDMFDFAAYHYGLEVTTDFIKILKNIQMDLNIEEVEDDQLSEYYKTLKNEDWTKSFSYKLTYDGYNNGMYKALAYFEKFGITEKTLKKYKVGAISKYVSLMHDKKIIKKVYTKDGELLIAYDCPYFAKIYKPEPKAFWYIGKKDREYVFGLQHIYNLSARTRSPIDLLIITGGEKDVLTLDSLGYNAISLNSETANLPKEVIDNKALGLAKEIVILYDIDETGKKAAAKLGSYITDLGYKCRVVTLPDDLIEQGGKDVSDYISLGLEITELDNLIQFPEEDAEVIISIQPIVLEEIIDSVVIKDEDFTKSITKIFEPTINAENYFSGNNSSSSTPYFSEKVYTNISPIIGGILDEISSRRDKDVFIMSFFTLFGAGLKNSYCWYGNKKIYPSLFTAVFSSSLSAKNIMDKAADLFKSSKKIDLISANTSFAALVKELARTNGTGIIYDPEIESIGEIRKYDKSGFSYALKNGFDHMDIVNNRSSKQNATVIAEPRFSFLTSGNSKQLSQISEDVEDSLLSRFCLYVYSEYTDITCKTSDFWRYGEMTKEKFTSSLKEFLEYLDSNSFELILSKIQEQSIDNFIANLKDNHSAISGININMISENSGKIAFKLATIFSACRKFENEDNANTLECNQDDFDIALSMANTLFQHSVIALMTLKEEKVNMALLPKDNKKEQLLNALPNCFSRKEALFLADELKLNKTERTIDNYLKEFVTSNVLTHSHDKYCKPAA